ncbi:MAG: tRNA (adenosine(37)-N6)-dimethylallyltransferase MiaA [Deltaproteobacteria bacterium]|nr:tRNA (adenosine(37)-N6)-dimethylallyltransferase MiaA [Deltaproteobacteria bacterium]MBW2172346.1 tRNA (adenosine(37)-N6)-dimethylallyltransferase MiaA [Deltaproteobacteria bacterium]
MSEKSALIIISGPTGVGKTDAAVTAAEPLGAEIVSADAMQVYRHMDIGTAKPTQEQQQRVRHHLIDVVYPDEPFSAALFKEMAEARIRDLHQKGCPVFIVGGTGLYIKALTRGLFPAEGGDDAIRKKLREEVETSGLEALYQRLRMVDPEAADRIHSNDTYRIIRALEVHQATGQPMSRHQRNHGFEDVGYRTLSIGLTLDRTILYDRIDKRVDLMLASGFLEEVRGLLGQGYSSALKSMRSIGYRHVADYLEGRVTWDETVRLFKRDTRRYAKRQLTWFKADPDIEWMGPDQIEVLRTKIDSFLG